MFNRSHSALGKETLKRIVVSRYARYVDASVGIAVQVSNRGVHSLSERAELVVGVVVGVQAAELHADR